MSETKKTVSGGVWEAIDNEKRQDRTVRRISVIAWTFTGVLVLVMAILVGIQIYHLTLGAFAGAVPWMSVAGAAMPFVITLGLLATLVATVSTIGVFIRMRTSSLHEIQLRLASLEDYLASQTGKSA